MRRSLVVCLCILAGSLVPVVSVPASPLNDGAILLGPCVQNVHTDGVTIIWETARPAENNAVFFSTDNVMWHQVSAPAGGTWHECVISDLAPGTYTYRVASDWIESDACSFQTAVQPGTPFTFIAYGDSRGVWDDWANASAVAGAVAAQRPHLVLHTGDLVRTGSLVDQWHRCFSVAHFTHHIPLYAAIGNHDCPARMFKRYLSLPGGELFYTFDYGDVHFVVLNSMFPAAYALRQRFFVITALETERPFTVVAFHHPPFSSGNHGNATGLQLLWAPLLETHGVDLVFNGHDHSYEHVNHDGLPYIVTGGGGAPLYAFGTSPWTVASESAYHFCRVDVNDTVITLTAQKPDGTVIDRLTVTADTGTCCTSHSSGILRAYAAAVRRFF
jgi:3',5'-cyclic AMP phosphodiesterase CpdA